VGATLIGERVMGVRLAPVCGGFAACGGGFAAGGGGGFAAGGGGGFVGMITAGAVIVGCGGDVAGGGGGGAPFSGVVAVVVADVAVGDGAMVLLEPRDWRATSSTAQTTIAMTANVMAAIASTAGVVRYHGTGCA